MNQNETLTIIVPCYNEAAAIPILYTEIMNRTSSEPLDKLDVRVLFVNDGSRDDTLAVLKELAAQHPNVKYLSFSRNFGKESAIYAGLHHANSTYTALMDADLQDPPALLEEMYRAIKNEKYDCVAARRSSRKGEPMVRSFFARRFYRIINAISKTEVVDGARDFRMMTRPVVEAILSLGEYNRFSKGIFSWVGFRVKWIAYENVKRSAGETKWSLWSLLLYSVNGIVSFSSAPLAVSSFLGILLSFFALLGIFFIIVRTLLFGDPVAGWPSLVVIITFIGGLQLLCLGIIGQYLAHTYMEVKRRPIYIISESNFNHSD